MFLTVLSAIINVAISSAASFDGKATPVVHVAASDHTPWKIVKKCSSLNSYRDLHGIDSFDFEALLPYTEALSGNIFISSKEMFYEQSICRCTCSSWGGIRSFWLHQKDRRCSQAIPATGQHSKLSLGSPQRCCWNTLDYAVALDFATRATDESLDLFRTACRQR